MDNRFADINESKKSMKKQLSQEEQDAKDVKIGCSYKFGQFLVKTIHFIDAAIGVTFVVYGSLIMTQFDNPAMEAAITSLAFGSIMLFTSAMGVIGFSTKLCNRCGLLVSAYMAPLVVCFYMFIIISLLAAPDAFFNYLTEHMSDMYLNAAQIQTMRNLLPLFYIIIASLAVVEIMRFFALRAIRDKLVRYDGAFKRRSTLGTSQDDSIRTGSIFSSLAEPLIEEDRL